MPRKRWDRVVASGRGKAALIGIAVAASALALWARRQQRAPRPLEHAANFSTAG